MHAKKTDYFNHRLTRLTVFVFSGDPWTHSSAGVWHHSGCADISTQTWQTPNNEDMIQAEHIYIYTYHSKFNTCLKEERYLKQHYLWLAVVLNVISICLILGCV